MDYDRSSPTGHKSRFSPLSFLGGFGIGSFVGVGVALLVFFLIHDDKVPTETIVKVPVAADIGPASAVEISPTPDNRARTTTQLDVRLGPGESFAVIGLLGKGEAVTPVGRNAESNWLAIQFPPGSAGRGWVPISALDGGVPGLDSLAIALPTPLPRTVSTFTSSSGTGSGSGSVLGPGTIGDSPTVTRTLPPTTATAQAIRGTPTPVVNQGPPDIVVNAVSLLPDGRVAVTIGNRGPGDLLNQAVFVVVRNLALQSEQLVSPAGVLKVGQTMTLTTSSFRVTEAQEIVAVADPFATINDPDRSNNTMRVNLAPLRPVTTTPTNGG